MKNRQFGVEIECGFRRNAYRAYDEARELLLDAGAAGTILPYWGDHMGHDGTLMEARSPILSGRQGFSELRRVMNLIRENGGYVTASDGLHIHHDAPEFVDDVDATLRLVQSWVANQALIDRFVSPGRRTSHACPKWELEGDSGDYGDLGIGHLEEYRKDREKKGDFKDGYWGRRDLNIASLREHGTIEIRLHQGSLDPVRAEAWIRFGQAFLNKVASVKNPIDRATSRTELLQRIRAPKYTHDNLRLYRG